MKKVISFVLVLLGLAVTGLCNPLVDGHGAYIDGNKGGKGMWDQFKVYTDARDKVEAWQKTGEGLTTDEVKDLVKVEIKNAVRSWVSAACACYLGALEAEDGNEDAAKEAYEAAVYWANKAIACEDDKSQEQGQKFLDIANSHLKK